MNADGAFVLQCSRTYEKAFENRKCVYVPVDNAEISQQHKRYFRFDFPEKKYESFGGEESESTH